MSSPAKPQSVAPPQQDSALSSSSYQPITLTRPSFTTPWGFRLYKRHGSSCVAEVVPGSPAATAMMSGVQLGDEILAVDGVLVSDQTTAEKMKGAGLRMTLVFGRTHGPLPTVSTPSPNKDPRLESTVSEASSPRRSKDARASGGPSQEQQAAAVRNKQEHPSPKSDEGKRAELGNPGIDPSKGSSRVPLRNLIRGSRGPVESWFWNTISGPGSSGGGKGPSGAATVKPPSFGRDLNPPPALDFFLHFLPILPISKGY
jgi:hypothetical protein